VFILNKHYRDTKKTINSITTKLPIQTKKERAIFVMVQNESVFLPIWLKYYSRYFSGDDIYVFNHRTTDGSLDACKKIFSFNVIDLDYPYSFDHKWFQFVINNTQRKLLEFYEHVVFTDIDEIILPDSEKYSGLDDYIDKLKTKYVRCKGYDLIHMKEKEPAFDSTKSVLVQRNYWYPTHWYDKTLISSIPLSWRKGNHQITKIRSNRDNNLLLIHLHKLDFDMCWNKNLEKAKLNWNEEDIRKNQGFQNRINQMDEFKKYYYHWPFKNLPIEEIPEKIKASKLF
jgi:hypothetical protein